jgi:hypothetical protein
VSLFCARRARPQAIVTVALESERRYRDVQVELAPTIATIEQLTPRSAILTPFEDNERRRRETTRIVH